MLLVAHHLSPSCAGAGFEQPWRSLRRTAPCRRGCTPASSSSLLGRTGPRRAPACHLSGRRGRRSPCPSVGRCPARLCSSGFFLVSPVAVVAGEIWRARPCSGSASTRPRRPELYGPMYTITSLSFDRRVGVRRLGGRRPLTATKPSASSLSWYSILKSPTFAAVLVDGHLDAVDDGVGLALRGPSPRQAGDDDNGVRIAFVAAGAPRGERQGEGPGKENVEPAEPHGPPRGEVRERERSGC